MPPDAQPALRVFLSYRRADAAGEAFLLRHTLVERLQERRVDVVMDVDDVQPGTDFVTEVQAIVGACDLVLLIIGPTWAASSTPRGERRLHDPHDFVRLEIDAALRRGVRIVPALVDGATLPVAADLPDALEPLTRLPALRLSSARWRSDVERVVNLIEELIPLDRSLEALPDEATPPDGGSGGSTTFVSYAGDNAQLVLPVCKEVSKHRGLWLFQGAVSGSSDWAEKVYYAIVNARDVMVMCSPAAFSSKHVIREVHLADRHSKPLVPVFIEAAEPIGVFGLLFADKQWLRLYEIPERERAVTLLDWLAASDRPTV